MRGEALVLTLEYSNRKCKLNLSHDKPTIRIKSQNLNLLFFEKSNIKSIQNFSLPIVA